MPEDYRHTEPVQVYETFAPPQPEEAAEPQLPARTWKEDPLLWIVVVVAVFMAVPFLASWATRMPLGSAARSAQAGSAPLAASEPATAEVATPRGGVPPEAMPDRPAPLPARAPADPARQTVTKCVENGRVVYTQTGECAGSVSAVPIDTRKNVIGAGGAASR